jgi:amidase
MFRYIKAALAPNIEPQLPPEYFAGIQAARKLSFTSSSDASISDFDPLVVSAYELSQMLNAQVITSVEIVEAYLHQIEQHNRRGRQLRALISVAPKHELLGIAERLDDERARGKIRGPLHGIPVVLKDNIMTDVKLGMDTTVGRSCVSPHNVLRVLMVHDRELRLCRLRTKKERYNSR